MFRVILLWSILLPNAALQAKGPEVGKVAPPYQVKLLDGSHLSDADQLGDVVILNFWATWCVPCRAEMPALEAYYQKHRAEGFKLVAISMDQPEDEAKVRQVMATFSFPAAMARDANFKGYGRIWRLALPFVIDRGGILRKDGWYGDAGIVFPCWRKPSRRSGRARLTFYGRAGDQKA